MSVSSNKITLACPNCGKRIKTSRLPQDPPNASEHRVCCPDCCVGGFDFDAHYFDSKGRELYGDPESEEWGTPRQ